MGERSRSKVLERAMKRRIRERRMIVARFCTALIIAMAFATFSRSLISFAGEKDMDKPSYKYYTSYTINKGDNLNKLADRYMTKEYHSSSNYIAEVAAINHLVSASDIYEGQTIILPYYSKDMK